MKLVVQHRAAECSHLRLALSISPNNSYVRFPNKGEFPQIWLADSGGSSATPEFEKRRRCYARPIGRSWRVDETYTTVH
jgi:hypothetical protein